MIDIKIIEHLAKLSRLDLTEEEKNKYQKDISKILEYVEKLQKLNVDLSNHLTFSEPDKPELISRVDEVSNCPTDARKIIIDSFPETEGALNKVKAVFE